MSDTISTPSSRRGWLALLQWSAVGAAAAVIVACGGGGVGAGGTGITANYSSGTVTGFGSVIVNGVHYDLSSSTSVKGDDDVDGPGSDSHRGVRLGVEVEVESGRITCATVGGTETCRADAQSISWGTSIAGPVAGLQPDGSFTVLGQRVLVTGATLFDGNGLAATKADLASGQVVEIHGRFNKATSETTATLIEVKAVSEAAAITAGVKYRLRGELQSLDRTLRTGTIAGQSVTFASDVTSAQLTALTVGQRVRVRIVPPAVGGIWSVDKVRSAGNDLSRHHGLEGEIKGKVSDLSVTGGVATFTIDGMKVQVSNTQTFTGLLFTDLVNGLTLEVEGTVQTVGGESVLVVRKVKLEDESGLEVEVTGTFTVDALAHTVTLGGKVFDFTDTTAVVFPRAGQSLANLAAWAAQNLRIEAKGLLQPDGVTIKLVRVKLENS